VLVAADREGLAQGAEAVISELNEALRRYELQDEIQVIETWSQSLKNKGPELIIYPEGSIMSACMNKMWMN
jgi:hypothetical protein